MKKDEKKLVSQKLRNYNKKNKIMYFLYFLSSISVFAFGLYYREVLELVGGVFLALRCIYLMNRHRANTSSLIRFERRKLSFLLLMIIIFSLINPIGILPFIMEIGKRDWVINGGLNEEKK
ncbi:hypothetical protein HV819_11030 [Anaerococcus sp. AGMB00486]|uniref:Uncharacterized protein n=2 Tax=Anaerococcus TaxID=165779 RepID=A0ABX2NCT2_9FIRM|nr:MULTISPECIES: hypothetical protein [Anaerococcus]MDY3005534.1 hypothetical protein [Anaerococcus porci]MSS78620.1 hypothetical protein [Anaerococcus porci]NVF12488.1 hypothetical protein [Anaerococcus faecalis]